MANENHYIIKGLEAQLAAALQVETGAKESMAEAAKNLALAQKEIVDLKALLSKFSMKNEEAAQPTPQKLSTINGYPMKGSWSDKCVYIIGKANKNMSTREVAEEIVTNYEKNYTRPEMVSKLAVPLSTTKTKFIRYERSDGTIEYGLK